MRDNKRTGTGRRASGPFTRALAAAALLALAAGRAAAFGFEPIVQDFAPSGREAVRTFRVDNPGTERIAVRVRVLSREADLDGRETLGEAPDLFVVYPERMVVEPGAVQAVRVQWKGPANPGRELCFRIVAEQLPVEFAGPDGSGAAIRVLFRYLGAVYVVPPAAAPDVVLASSRMATDAAGHAGLELVFANRGTAHAILGGLSITVGSRTFGEGALAGIIGENVLPGLARRFFLPLDPPPEEGADVTFTFEALR